MEGDHALGHTHSSNSANTAILVITGLVSHELALPKHIPFASPFEREGIMLCMVGGLNNFPNTKGHFRAVLKQQLWRAFLPVLCIRRHQNHRLHVPFDSPRITGIRAVLDNGLVTLSRYHDPRTGHRSLPWDPPL